MRRRPTTLEPQLSNSNPCPNCDCDLSLHQPDIELPDRLLGTCPACKSWFLLDGSGQIRLALATGVDLYIESHDRTQSG